MLPHDIFDLSAWNLQIVFFLNLFDRDVLEPGIVMCTHYEPIYIRIETQCFSDTRMISLSANRATIGNNICVAV